MREIHVFDVDGTLVDTREATLAAYEAASPGLFKPEYWGKPSQEWGCPADVHERKVAAFARLSAMIKPAWAMPMFRHAQYVGHHCIFLTGASEDTMDIHRTRFRKLAAHDCHCSLSTADKRRYLEDLVRADPTCAIHYYDDADWSVTDAIVSGLGVQVHAPVDSSLPPARVVILAAGLGSRFRATGIPKPFMEFAGVPMLGRATSIAGEVDTEPIIIVPSILAYGIHGHTVISVGVTQRGPAESALLAGAHMHPTDPVVFLDCDTCLSPGTLHDFAGRSMEVGALSAVLTADRGTNVGRYGTVERVHGSVTIQEGGVGQQCIVGAYYVSSWHLFRRALAQVYLRTPRDQEIKMSDVLKAIGDITAVHTDTRNWIPLGTPEELAHANQGTR
jgi:hypothetical protein